MNFLVDNALWPRVAELLKAAGHDAVHVRDRAQHQAEDEVIFELAAADGRVLVSADTDFGTILTSLQRAQRREVVQAARSSLIDSN